MGARQSPMLTQPTCSGRGAAAPGDDRYLTPNQTSRNSSMVRTRNPRAHKLGREWAKMAPVQSARTDRNFLGVRRSLLKELRLATQRGDRASARVP
jgi:hypothetical protein